MDEQIREQLEAAAAAVAELKADIAAHNSKMVAFNNSSGKISAVDQTSLTELVKSAAALKAKVNDIEVPTLPPGPSVKTSSSGDPVLNTPKP